MLYSSTARGFYDPQLHGDAIPADAVPVTDEHMTELFEGQARGAQIVPGPGGAPTLLWPTPPTEAELLAAWRERTTVSAFQAKAALFNRGLLDAANAAATGAGGLTLLAWQTATEYPRLSPAIVTLAPVIGITDPADLDDLFREAALISA
ncbi:MAG: hypothetical protein IOC92_14620 [Rhodobacter sp.]|nr:hypothetical protein [Rhodobacter sp.]MCA3462265.1 hypothetical protein [Rhodobacter sp.]MCA3462750.1 hypothetical protein [Rhodobacter sp.]MCA3468111.1 hypothetical protein [Rhodobacter sp.]MCA3480865.1 hypothetical protein [Rhodobacter sp.]